VLESKAIKFIRCFDKKTGHENSFSEEKIKRLSKTCKILGNTYKELGVLSTRGG
jgi:hypothetical protein